MADKVKINNFTVFRDFSIDFCKGINVLIGKNGVGKTHLLKTMVVGVTALKEDLRSKSEVHETMVIPSEIEEQNFESIFDADQISEYMKQVGAEFEMSSTGYTCPQVVFIPEKEMLSHASGLLTMKKKYGANMPFDFTLLDIIEKAQAWRLKEIPDIAKSITPALEKIMNGTVEVREDGSFWMKKNNGKAIPFSMEAEGIKRLGLLWQLLMNESIDKNTLLLWDEPETSINPENIPVLVDAILELQRHGVKVVLATHSYSFARYFDILRKGDDAVQYFCLYLSEDGFAQYAKADSFAALNPNPIDDAGEKLYNDSIQKSLEVL